MHPDAVPYSNSYFGDHLYPSDMYFNCFGNESSLANCQTVTTSCGFESVAGVCCAGQVITGTQCHHIIGGDVFLSVLGH